MCSVIQEIRWRLGLGQRSLQGDEAQKMHTHNSDLNGAMKLLKAFDELLGSIQAKQPAAA